MLAKGVILEVEGMIEMKLNQDHYLDEDLLEESGNRSKSKSPKRDDDRFFKCKQFEHFAKNCPEQDIDGRNSSKVESSQLYRDIDTQMYSKQEEDHSRLTGQESYNSIIPSGQNDVLEHLAWKGWERMHQIFTPCTAYYNWLIMFISNIMYHKYPQCNSSASDKLFNEYTFLAQSLELL